MKPKILMVFKLMIIFLAIAIIVMRAERVHGDVQCIPGVSESTATVKECVPPQNYIDNDWSIYASYYQLTWGVTPSITMRGECGTHQPTCCWFSTSINCEPERHQWEIVDLGNDQMLFRVSGWNRGIEGIWESCTWPCDDKFVKSCQYQGYVYAEAWMDCCQLWP